MVGARRAGADRAGASVPVFRERLPTRIRTSAGPRPKGSAAPGTRESIDALERNVTTDESVMVRMAAAFALQKLGRNYAARIVDMMNSSKVTAQGQEYLVELGPGGRARRWCRACRIPIAALREAFADVLGVIGDESALSRAPSGGEGSRSDGRRRGQARHRPHQDAQVTAPQSARAFEFSPRFLRTSRHSTSRGI